ncbi:hypothetical protein FDC49_18075 [Clostridium sporogenes]|uniref:hypothetical protein n=1 Tax=Clostridium sporogenes TaxID=1509 RepID=UPI0013D21703|nr:MULTISPECIES: hypothetical protein [Clostridium]MBO0573421.1 hypothetical protein [Clostridium botulinum]NFH34362.1 hypothetical protein [Clostridium sporogenes]NFL21612.1 hypothetical protein [Clostridium sporogenes]NFN73460.1 hypothetical protein [Clostridium sporogenes]NFV23083.1 hypothetical protein [Clostridium sporogenes]
MNNTIDSIAKTLLYNGPTPQEIILDAINNGHNINIIDDNSFTNIVVKSIIAYDIEVIDKYLYDNEEKLIKHIIKVNSKEKIIFDKYVEASTMINKLKNFEKIAS